MPQGIRAIGGQHDVRDGAWQELAPPHSSPLIRTTLGQHKFFHVHLQHLFIISTKPQDITASDTLESFQELQTEAGFHQQQFPSRGERFLWFGLRTEAQETWLSPDAAVAPAVLRREGCTGHGPVTGTKLRCPRAVATLAGREPGCIARALPSQSHHLCLPRQNTAPARSSPSIGLTPASLPCSVSTRACTNSFSLSPSPPLFFFTNQVVIIKKCLFLLRARGLQLMAGFKATPVSARPCGAPRSFQESYQS